ncbi:MAG: hypothetical protein HQM14_11210 [SAR324 cluster bacterium]|nr:hypothetical protein [SAR324 cluster bacterium]
MNTVTLYKIEIPVFFSAKWVVRIVLVGLLLVGIFSAAQLEKRYSLQHRTESFLYLADSQYLRLLSLGQEELLSDILLIQGAVYFGEHYREYARNNFQYDYKWLYPIFNVATDLDPLNYEAYILGGHVLPDPHESIRLYEKGMLQFPEDWKLPELIGFQYFYELHDKATAAKYYDQASRLSGRPPYVASLAAKYYRDAGYYESAIRVLKESAANTEREGVKAEFLKRAEFLQLTLNVQVAVEIFKKRQGRLPGSVEELIVFGVITEYPLLEEGWKILIDYETEKVIIHQQKGSHGKVR